MSFDALALKVLVVIMLVFLVTFFLALVVGAGYILVWTVYKGWKYLREEFPFRDDIIIRKK